MAVGGRVSAIPYSSWEEGPAQQASLVFLRARLSCRHSGLVGLWPHRALFGHFSPLPQPLGYCSLGLPWGPAPPAAICTWLPERQRAAWGHWEVTPTAKETLGAGGVGGESEWETQQARRRAGALPQALGEALI